MLQTVPTSQAALKIEFAGYAGGNRFGWYDTRQTTPTLHEIFAGGDSPPDAVYFNPTPSYGFWFISQAGKTFYTESSRQGAGNDPGSQHFAIFQESATLGREVYWMGIEDLVLSSGDRDYQDMVVKISAVSVPDGGVTLMLLGGVLVGLEALRRRLRA
jgi:hypothetical protein